MSNIHAVLSEGHAIQLGPVTVTKTYDRKPGDKNRFVLIRDESGQGALKIWGAAANTPLQENQVITLIGTAPKGGLKTSVYNDKTSIDANDCRLQIAGQESSQASPDVQPVQYVRAAAPPRATGTSLPSKDDQIMRQNALAHATALVIASGVKNPYSDQTLVLQLAERYAHYSATGDVGQEIEYIPM